MRVAMISENTGSLGAGGRHVLELAEALAELGHDVRIHTRRDDPAAPDVVRAPGGVPVVRVPAGPARVLPVQERLPCLGEFARWLGRSWRDGDWAPAVVHAHFWTGGLAAVTAARRIGVPVVQSFHELGAGPAEPGGNGPSRAGYERALGRAVDRVLARSQQEVGELVDRGVPRPRITFVPAGVDSRRFNPDGPVAERDPRRPRILAVGRLADGTGYGAVVRAMRAVPGAEFVLIGGPPAAGLPDDPQAARLRELAVRCQVADRVRLVGAVTSADLPAWYRSADVFVVAPGQDRYEAAPLEAMACGVPVVGVASGALPETVVDGLTGDLVPAADPEALGGTLRRLIIDPVRRFAYATAALDRARQAYSWQRAAAQVGAVYAALESRSDAEAVA
ncbi:glycosyltransferase involved in cell wall biosynthesis [Krasilnikovia cinnamomea]|uniref:Glycosyltransferase involved in cell wall biosynthesis n=1 Tax=Krasilnikovia cinnamomea TaxID=349313 RepID=A0A4Q7ZEA2_9ACTN|nr:glycosyltransferase [Krasilnikovia cinnamomea]RZU49040.1 glycosyltransferase involved in cell wall biosynthesis [Krasilnikovia cinnamomea]